MELTDGCAAVRAARSCAEAETKKETAHPYFPESFSENKGVFVTILKYPSGNLRGCIGYPEPVLPLRTAIMMSAAAACHDPRFHDLTFSETDACTFEVTVLTVPRIVEYQSPHELLSKIAVGRDGLILTHGGNRGLLLPQVPAEFGWDAEEFLNHLSVKAGLNRNAWTDPNVKIEVFRGEIFAEISPRGEIIGK
jgi:uncharacterized protein (TIGR00296 family)